MSGFGVFWDGPIESQPGFTEVPETIARFIPEDIHTWTVTHGGLGKDDRVWGVPEPVDKTRFNRIDQAFSHDGRYVAVGYGMDWQRCRPIRNCTVEDRQEYGDKGFIVAGRF